MGNPDGQVHAQDVSSAEREKAAAAGEQRPKNTSGRRPKTTSVSDGTWEVAKALLAKCLKDARHKHKVFKRWNRALSATSIVLSGSAGVISAIVAGGGERAAATMPGGWQAACWVVAAMSGAVAVLSLLSSNFQVPQTVGRARDCVMQLDILAVDFEEPPRQQRMSALKKIRKTYPDILVGD